MAHARRNLIDPASYLHNVCISRAIELTLYSYDSSAGIMWRSTLVAIIFANCTAIFEDFEDEIIVFSDFLFQMKTAVGRLSVSNYCTRSLWRYSSKLLLLSKIVLQDFLQTECLSNWRPINTHRQAMCTYERIRICQAGGVAYAAPTRKII